MKSKYKQLGQYINEVNNRDSEFKEKLIAAKDEITAYNLIREYDVEGR